MEADEDLVCGVLQASARFVQHPGSFACKLAELVAIGHVRKCPKNQIRTHKVDLLPDLSDRYYLVPAVQLMARYKVELLPHTAYSPFRRTKWASSSKNFCRKTSLNGNRECALQRIEVTAPANFAFRCFQPTRNPKRILPPMDESGPEIEGGKSGKTRDRVVQSSPRDGTHECTTGPFWGQHFFCANQGAELDKVFDLVVNVGRYLCDIYIRLSAQDESWRTGRSAARKLTNYWSYGRCVTPIT